MTTAQMTAGQTTTAQSEFPWRVAALVPMAAGCALLIDVPAAQWLTQGHAPKFLVKVCGLSEVFAHGIGVALIAMAVYVLDPARRSKLPRLLAAAYGAGLCANGLKLLVARTRPHDFDFVQGVAGTFAGWLPLGRGGSGVQSFPSSHAATALGLAVALAWLYPHGRRLFTALAVLACAQRLLVSAHYLSDVLLGGGVGWMFATGCILRGPLARHFDNWEAAWQRRGIAALPDVESTTPAILPLRTQTADDQTAAAAG